MGVGVIQETVHVCSNPRHAHAGFCVGSTTPTALGVELEIVEVQREGWTGLAGARF